MQFSIITIAALASSAMAAPPVLLPRVDCSSKSCQALVDEGSCILDAGQNVIKLIKCLADAGGVSNVCPCIACLPDPLGDFLSQPGVC
ncbi:hypothetical protein NKR19_g3747 [Coniochaeta hoffmannii]|uniref:Fungal calcium binding protein domain-containing protein n=1 Tax=Coniochaeta hoffmannii TaxID=91930 RepID=A0AA38VYK0_9PEZI|nr:hypothetical protein NKR19_g3747 [Coniochaeta hoffmannii]